MVVSELVGEVEEFYQEGDGDNNTTMNLIKCHDCGKCIHDEIVYNKGDGSPFCSVECLKRRALDNLDIRTCPVDGWYGDEE